MLAIRIVKELEKELDLLAKTRGSTRSAVVREAIIQFLEDNEDLQLAKGSLSIMRNTKSLKQLDTDNRFIGRDFENQGIKL
jgi:RHH-type rel operon transcriptional repressor/antitoxin RelB